MKRFFAAFIICFAYLVCQAEGQDYKFERTFIYNFTKYIKWPDSYKSGDFVIGVLGDSPIYDQLQLMASTRTAGAQKFSIKKISSPSEIQNYHMVFVPSNQSGKIDAVISKTKGKSTLIITEGEGMGTRGSCINFIYINGKPRFELNQDAATKHNLKVSGELMRLAILI